MTLDEFKQSVFALIEEYNENSDVLTDDDDIANKINPAINIILTEVSRFKKIPANKTIEVTENQEIKLSDIDSNIYQLYVIRGVAYERLENTIIFEEDGTAKIYYYKYPTQITDDTDDEFVLEVDLDALEIAKLGVAGLVLASDVSNNYGQVYTNMYREKLQMLDSRLGVPTIQFNGGLDI